MAQKINITRGTNYDQTVSYAENGIAQSIVGDTLYLTAKAVLDADNTDAAAIIAKTITPVPNTPAAVAGNYTFNLAYADTDIPAGQYNVDILIKRVSTTGKRYLLGSMIYNITLTPTNRNT